LQDGEAGADMSIIPQVFRLIGNEAPRSTRGAHAAQAAGYSGEGE